MLKKNIILARVRNQTFQDFVNVKHDIFELIRMEHILLQSIKFQV